MTSARILALTVSSLLCTTLTTSASAFDLKPKVFPLTVLGVKVDIPVTISFDANTEGDALALHVRAQANLKGAQDKALDIARAIPVPRGNCDRNGANPVVNSIDSASIAPASQNSAATRKIAPPCANVSLITTSRS
jgi:hypothetical protein